MNESALSKALWGSGGVREDGLVYAIEDYVGWEIAKLREI